MAREFANYSPVVPLGTTWEESLRFLDEDGEPVDLTDCDVRAQIRAEEVLRDPNTGLGDSAPLLEVITDAALYPSAPAWPLIEGFTVGIDPEAPDTPDPTNGYVGLRVDADDTWHLSPTNERAKRLWDVEILDEADEAVIPLVTGKVIATRRRTLPIPT
jgi:hypothetical protein